MLTTVIHIDELDKWSLALGNIRNIVKELVEVEMVIVVNGPAINGYLEPAIRAQIAELPTVNLRFEACENAMRGHHISTADLPSHVVPVPAGVLRLIELQHQGYAYIKP